MLEKKIEKYLEQEVKKAGGLCIKFKSANKNGIPDRIVLFNLARIYFIELKRPGRHLDPLQKYWKKVLSALGFTVLKIDTKEKVNKFIKEVVNGV